MTLKNTDNEYRITVSNRQTIDSETDTIEETAYGNYTEKNGKQYITYKTENDGDKISSMIKNRRQRDTYKTYGKCKFVNDV